MRKSEETITQTGPHNRGPQVPVVEVVLPRRKEGPKRPSSGRAVKIMYWIATLWLSLGMVSTGIVQLLKLPDDVNLMQRLGYPVYLLTILGIWKLLGVIAILVPGFKIIKEWAYAGFFFAMSGAIVSHVASGSGAIDFFGPVLLLILTLISWNFRPANRRIAWE